MTDGEALSRMMGLRCGGRQLKWVRWPSKRWKTTLELNPKATGSHFRFLE